MNLQSVFTDLRAGCEATLRNTAERPWVGRLLMLCMGFSVVGCLAVIVFGLVLIFLVASHGAGDLSGGMGTALLWLFGLLGAVLMLLLRFWWVYGRDGRPRSGHRDLEAAQAGDAAAAHRLARHYAAGDALSARSWLLQAARSGHPEAMVDLANMLRTGHGGTRDLAGARVWLARAAEAGHPGAAVPLAEVEAQLADRHHEGEA